MRSARVLLYVYVFAFYTSVSSMIGSIASSMDLARSVIADEQIADGAENAGVEQFASLIDQVISRIKVIFENLTIRVEAYSDICTGIEIQIDRYSSSPTLC